MIAVIIYFLGGTVCMSMYWATSSDMMLGITSVYVTLISVSSTAVVSVVVDLFPTSLR